VEFFKEDKTLEEKLPKFIIRDKQNVKYVERFKAALRTKDKMKPQLPSLPTLNQLKNQ